MASLANRNFNLSYNDSAAAVSLETKSFPSASGPLNQIVMPANPGDTIRSRLIRAVPYGPEPHQLLDLYLPGRARPGRRVPTIVFVHSGGWIGGSQANVADVAAAQVARGYALASVDCQLAKQRGSGPFPAVVYDVKRAIRFLKANAVTWGLDPARMVVMGSSAGGQLAALSGTSAGQLEPALTGPLAILDSSVVAIVDVVGTTDLGAFATTPTLGSLRSPPTFSDARSETAAPRARPTFCARRRSRLTSTRQAPRSSWPTARRTTWWSPRPRAPRSLAPGYRPTVAIPAQRCTRWCPEAVTTWVPTRST